MKTVLLIIVFSAAAFFANAQYADTHFGIKAGVNVSSLDVKDGVDFDSKVGLHIGALAHIHLSPHFGIQPEVFYSEQGGEDGDEKWKINYVDVPVLFQYMAGNGFRVQTGPQVGIKTSSKIKNGNVEVKNNDVNTLDFSWPVGISYITASGLGIDARYNIGISNVNDESTPEVRNRVFQAGLFYQFSTTKRK
jgi:hypothetical protein